MGLFFRGLTRNLNASAMPWVFDNAMLPTL